MVRVSPGGGELLSLAAALTAPLSEGGRRIVGVAGAPGSGKSRLADGLARALGSRVAVVPLDGFHLADAELGRQGLLDRKGAPETFDAWGYAALLDRLRRRPGHDVYAPGFERTLEQPLAQAVAVGPDVDVVLTEGNYLLLDRPEWRAARGLLDDTWFVVTDEPLRLRRLQARHVAFGKTPSAAERWMSTVDEPNAGLVGESRVRAARVLDLTRWDGAVPSFG